MRNSMNTEHGSRPSSWCGRWLARGLLAVFVGGFVKMGATKFVSPRATTFLPAHSLVLPPDFGDEVPSHSTNILSFTGIEHTPTSTVLGVGWEAGMLTADSLVWIFGRTNLVAGSWEPLLGVRPRPGETSLSVEIPHASLPGATADAPYVYRECLAAPGEWGYGRCLSQPGTRIRRTVKWCAKQSLAELVE